MEKIIYRYKIVFFNNTTNLSIPENQIELTKIELDDETYKEWLDNPAAKVFDNRPIPCAPRLTYIPSHYIQVDGMNLSEVKEKLIELLKKVCNMMQTYAKTDEAKSRYDIDFWLNVLHDYEVANSI